MMKRIGLTQRVEIIQSYQERRDCLDQSWTRLLISLGLIPILLPNIARPTEARKYIEQLKLDGVILTGGNDLGWTKSKHVAHERDDFEQVLIEYCCSHLLPVLGVCRGMQMINIYFGGQLIQVDNHVTADHPIEFKNGKIYQVNSYHDWGISERELSLDLVPLAYSKDELVEYCKHNELPITGMMWHPERPNSDHEIGVKIIKETFL